MCCVMDLERVGEDAREQEPRDVRRRRVDARAPQPQAEHAARAAVRRNDRTTRRLCRCCVFSPFESIHQTKPNQTNSNEPGVDRWWGVGHKSITPFPPNATARATTPRRDDSMRDGATMWMWMWMWMRRRMWMWMWMWTWTWT